MVEGATVTVEISTCKGAKNRIDVDWDTGGNRYAFAQCVAAVKQVDGYGFIKEPRKHWHVPLDMESCRRLRSVYGSALQIGPNLYSWAVNAARQERTLGSLAAADTAALVRLQDHLPTLYRAMHLGPKGLIMSDEEKAAHLATGDPSFQCADVRFLVESPHPLNGNQQGLGKTPEWIAAVWEAGIEAGSHLVIAPSAAVDGTWEPELEQWQADANVEVGIFACTGNRKQREEVIASFMASTAPVKWLCVNPQMVQFRKDPSRTSSLIISIPGENKKSRAGCHCGAKKGSHEHYLTPYPELFQIHWATTAIDECHKGNIRNHKTLTSQSIHTLRQDKRTCFSGTPMKKQGSDLWGILHWLRPDVFTSYWRLAEGYFDVDDNGYGKKVGALRADREEAFYRMLMPYVIRRTKAEVLPWLPPKHYVEVPCNMTEAQVKQYNEMEEDGAARLGDDRVTTTSILAEFTRLSQFSFGAWAFNDTGKMVPTEDSGKLEAMLQKMEEANVFEDSTVKQLVFSQYREVVELVARVLEAKGVKVSIVSGKQNKRGQRRAIREAFQTGDTQVLCIVTTAGGVSLTLDAADTVHMLDDMWSPDDTEQAEDRAHRASRVHQVTVYQYRTKDSIDQYRAETSADKEVQQKRILDGRRAIVAKWLEAKPAKART